MTFLNASLIFALIAIAIPIVLHFIARREPRKVVFPSVQFLTRRFQSNRTRLRIRRWWLLALRIAALAMLALALAHPVIHQSMSITWLTIGLVAAVGMILLVMGSVASTRRHRRSGSRDQPDGSRRSTSIGLLIAASVLLGTAMIWGAHTWARGPTPSTDVNEPVAIALVLDNAPTSAWKTANDHRIARMKDLATWMVTRLPQTSRIAIVDRGSQVASFSIDPASAIARIDQLRPLEVVQPIESRLSAAARLVRTSDLANRQILVITDLNASTWEPSQTDGTPRAAWLDETPPINLTVFDLGKFEGWNRAIDRLQLADQSPPQNVPFSVSATFQVTHALQTQPVSVTAELQFYENDPALPVVRDGKVVRPKLTTVDRASVQIKPGDAADVLLSAPSLDVGLHHGHVRLVGDDAMPLDDARYFTVQVRPPSPVLLVSDNDDEARVMEATITAGTGTLDGEAMEYAVERVSYQDLPVVRLADFHGVVLLDPPRPVLSDQDIAEYVADGGGVFVCLGPSAGDQPVDDNTWTPPLVRRWRVPQPGTFLQISSANHPVTEILTGDTPWSDYRVYQYWQVKPDATDMVLAQYAGQGHPAVVVRSLAPENSANGMADRGTPNEAAPSPSGLVVVVTTPMPALTPSTKAWNDLFGIDPWPAWLLTRQIVEFVTRRNGQPWTTTVGQPKRIPLPEDPQGGESIERLQLFPPGDSPPVPLDLPAGARQITITDVDRQGTYWIRGTQLNSGFSANPNPDVMRLERVDPTVLDQHFGPQRYTLVTNREGIEVAEDKASQRVSLLSPMMFLALSVFLLEQVLSNRFYRSSSPTGKTETRRQATRSPVAS